MGDALAAEWWKLRSVRSTYIVLSVAAAFTWFVLLLALRMAHVWDGLPAERRQDLLLRPLQELGGWAASPCLAILGVVSVTSEYRTGMIRMSLIAVPARRTLLLAKATVIGAAALVVGEAVTVGSFLGTRLAVGGRPFPDQQASIAHDLPGFVLAGTVVPVFALLGLSLGVLLRSAAGSIVSVVFVWHVLPLLVHHLPEPWNERAGAAAAVLVAYALVPLGAAAFLLARRDA